MSCMLSTDESRKLTMRVTFPVTKNERVSVCLLTPAIILYGLAFFTHSWFELPGVSYGLWWAVFCDYLKCHIVPAFFTEEPVWYHILQICSVMGLFGMLGSLSLLTTKRFDSYIPQHMRRQQTASACSIGSVFIISFTLVMFYGKLDESSMKDTPQIHYSAILAAVSCLLELGAGLLLLQT